MTSAPLASPVALRMWELLEALEARGLLAPDATFEEFEALMDRLEQAPASQLQDH